MVGSIVQDGLFSIIVRFHIHTYVFATNIVKIYCQIKVKPKHQNLQCTICRYSPDEELSIYKLTIVTYGIASAPYLATRTLNQITTAQTIKDFYVDYILSVSSTEQQAKLIINDIILMLQQGGFELGK